MSTPEGPENIVRFVNTPPSRPRPDEDEHTRRERLMRRILWQGRRLSSISMLYSMATADHLGMNLSDMLCLGILSGAGPITPGQLATLTGLSTGAVTGLVDRLERLDLVRRERDEEDRRRVVLHLNADRAEEIGQAFEAMLKAGWQNLEQFSNEELGTIARYTDGAIGFMQEATREMRSREKAPIAPLLAEADLDG
jgi:DNA-binding MarR family transcriptional regulator